MEEARVNTYKFYTPGCSLFGYGSLKGLGTELSDRGYQKALVVTDQSLVQLGVVKQLTDILEIAHIHYCVFDGVKPNPTSGNVDAGLSALRRENCDFVISIGGGSAHDCAKAITIVATNGGNIVNYQGTDQSKILPLPLVAVNTTAGTASETTRAYVIVDENTGVKFGSKDKHVIPVVAVDDHQLMMGLPEGLTAGTGMDALTHAVEAFTSVNGFLITSELALAAIRLVFRNLEKAVHSPDAESREGMAVGQYLAGLAFGNAGCGLVHSMSHQLSAVYDLPHGLCNAVILPSVCRFNCADKAALKKYAQIGETVFPLATDGKCDEEKAEIFINKIEVLSRQIGTDRRLSSLQVEETAIPLLAEKTLLDGSLGNNPVQPSKTQVEALFAALM